MGYTLLYYRTSQEGSLQEAIDNGAVCRHDFTEYEMQLYIAPDASLLHEPFVNVVRIVKQAANMMEHRAEISLTLMRGETVVDSLTFT